MSDSSYDAIIIGAGIGGLVCGCYLAKAGMKVLICEQHSKPGGYCTSFKRQGFTFDAAAHCIGGYRENGWVKKVFENLEINKMIKIERADPSTIIVTPLYTILFYSDLNETIKSFQDSFQSEKNNIRDFFYFLTQSEPSSFFKLKNLTFEQLLNRYFTNKHLKAILSIPLLATGGLPSSEMSAFLGAKIYSEFLIDGGYYILGGLQQLGNALAEQLKEWGGEIRLSNLVKKIVINDNTVRGIITEKDGFIPAKYVISNCDALQTFLTLIDKKWIPKSFYKRVKEMSPSISYFILYLGMNCNFKFPFNPGANICYFQHYSPEKAYEAAQKRNIFDIGGYFLHVSQDKSVITVYIPISFGERDFWIDKKGLFMDFLITKVEETIIPNLSQYVIYKDAASPYTLYRYTLNQKGAAFGWAITSSQIGISDFKQPRFIRNLYLVGHWTTFGIGIPGVMYVAKEIADLILKKRLYTNE